MGQDQSIISMCSLNVFMMEEELDGQISFLDVLLKRDEFDFSSSVYMYTKATVYAACLYSFIGFCLTFLLQSWHGTPLPQLHVSGIMLLYQVCVKNLLNVVADMMTVFLLMGLQTFSMHLLIDQATPHSSNRYGHHYRALQICNSQSKQADIFYLHSTLRIP